MNTRNLLLGVFVFALVFSGRTPAQPGGKEAAGGTLLQHSLLACEMDHEMADTLERHLSGDGATAAAVYEAAVRSRPTRKSN